MIKKRVLDVRKFGILSYLKLLRKHFISNSRRILLVFGSFLLLTTNNVLSQTTIKLDVYNNPLNGLKDKKKKFKAKDNVYKHILIKQLRSDFHSTLLNAQIPSELSVFSNWRNEVNGYQKKNFVLDSDLKIPIGLKGPLSKYLLTSFQIQPRFKARIFRNDSLAHNNIGDLSLPVRTPSTMGGIAVYFSTPKLWSTLNNDMNLFWGVNVYHNSNGQDGEEFTAEGDINTYNGNFSENVVYEFIFGGIKRFDLINNPKRNRKLYNRKLYEKVKRELFYSINYENHAKRWTNKKFLEKKMLGRHRLNLNLNYVIIKIYSEFFNTSDEWTKIDNSSSAEKFRHSLNLSYILDKEYNVGNINSLERVGLFDGSKRLNISYTFYYILGNGQNTSLFGQIGYQGSDDYNIYFQNSNSKIRFGVAIAPFYHKDNSVKLNQTK